MTDCHSWRNSMRIYNHIWNNTFWCEGKILLSVSHTNCAFLTMTRCKFISNLGNFYSSHFDFNISDLFFGNSKYNLVNITFFWVFKWNRLILSRFLSYLPVKLLVLVLFNQIILHRRLNCFTNNNIVSTNLSAGRYYSITVKLIIVTVLSTTCLVLVGYMDTFFIALVCVVSSIKDASKETSVDCRLVKHDGIFLIVSTVASNRNYTIATGSQLLESQILHTSRRN